MADSETVTADYRVVTLPCSGQTQCYDDEAEVSCDSLDSAFYGQDAQYVAAGMCVPRSYSINGITPEEIVTDNYTRLDWQRTLSPNTYGWQEAIDYCAGLIYGGYEDWRLPNDRELESIINNGYDRPAIDGGAFPHTPSSFFWSSRPNMDSLEEWAWGVDFGDATTRFGNKGTKYSVRCVRGNERSFSSIFSLSEKPIVTDRTSGLIWTMYYSSSVSWQASLGYCQSLNYAGYQDWRLPNIYELKTLIYRGKANPASYFPDMPSICFWSSSSDVGWGELAFSVDFSRGEVRRVLKNGYWDLCSAFCVR
ncbi:MAG TPA: DUF1566 domain-containing protein [Alphaproteobacteria bacterium]|nr:DUF1566 domain-containing protein [Alphaproteobacteria bacterium]